MLEQCHHKSTGMCEHGSIAQQFMGTSIAIVMTQGRGVRKPQCIAIVLSTLMSCTFNKFLKIYSQLSVMCTTCTTKKQRQSMKSKITVLRKWVPSAKFGTWQTGLALSHCSLCYGVCGCWHLATLGCQTGLFFSSKHDRNSLSLQCKDRY